MILLPYFLTTYSMPLVPIELAGVLEKVPRICRPVSLTSTSTNSRMLTAFRRNIQGVLQNWMSARLGNMHRRGRISQRQRRRRLYIYHTAHGQGRSQRHLRRKQWLRLRCGRMLLAIRLVRHVECILQGWMPVSVRNVRIKGTKMAT
jgi:hypothetical protein